jgi:hypothetical protein
MYDLKLAELSGTKDGTYERKLMGFKQIVKTKISQTYSGINEIKSRLNLWNACYYSV